MSAAILARFPSFDERVRLENVREAAIQDEKKDRFRMKRLALPLGYLDVSVAGEALWRSGDAEDCNSVVWQGVAAAIDIQRQLSQR